ncbi:hypothetical protein E4U53_007232 [Claviceps sorghi]|nr:hypothetical protein E4U53_007232 [Claviceps sorghi]
MALSLLKSPYRRHIVKRLIPRPRQEGQLRHPCAINVITDTETTEKRDSAASRTVSSSRFLCTRNNASVPKSSTISADPALTHHGTPTAQSVESSCLYGIG